MPSKSKPCPACSSTGRFHKRDCPVDMNEKAKRAAEPAPRTVDAAGRPVRRTRDGYAYVVVGGERWYVSECCGSPATVSMGVMSCKGCYAEVDEILGAIPPAPESVA